MEQDESERDLGDRITGLEDRLVIKNKKEESRIPLSVLVWAASGQATISMGHHWLGWGRFCCHLEHSEWEGLDPAKGSVLQVVVNMDYMKIKRDI